MFAAGLVLGSRSATVFRDVVQRLTHFLEVHRRPEKPFVTVVFFVPGLAVPSRFYGVEIGAFNSAQGLLDIEIGVEEEWLQASEREVIRYVYDVTDEALGSAQGWLAERNFSFDVGAARELLDQWKTSELQG